MSVDVTKFLCIGPKFKTHTIQKRQKLLGSNIYLENGEEVTEIDPEDEDGYLFVRAKSGKEGQIPKSCLGRKEDKSRRLKMIYYFSWRSD